MANEIIKEEAKATAELVEKAIVPVPVHKEQVSQKIYVGPNLPGLIKYTVVESVKLNHIQTIVEDCPEVEKLIVPIDQMAAVEARAAQVGTLEHRYFKKILEYKAGGAS